MADSPTLRASIALAAYAEPLVEGRRAIVFGDASSGLAESLLERGARLVHVYDPDAMRLAEAATRNTSRNIAFAPLAETGLAVREGAFDVALIENLAAFADVPGVVKRAKKALSARGALIAAAPNPEVRVRLLAEPLATATELDYYGLYDAVAAEFEQVRMLGQTPFVGYSVVDFAPDGEPEPTFDAGFVPGGAEEPEWFVALGAQRPVRLDDFELVQLPFRAALDASTRARERAPVVAPAPAVDVTPLHKEIATLRADLERRDAWIAQLESRAEAADTRADEMQGELDTTRRELADTRQRAASLGERAASAEAAAKSAREASAEAAAKNARAASAEAAAKSAREASAEAAAKSAREASAEAAAKSAREAANESRAAKARIGELEAEAATLKSDLAADQVRRHELEAEVTRLARKVETLEAAEPAGPADELVALEAQLVERGAEVRRLEQELRTADRFGRQLLDELDQARGEASASDGGQLGALGQKLDALASLNAEREADLQTARWTIATLEARLVEGEPPPADRERLEQDLHQARADLQKLATLVDELKATKAAEGAEAPR